MRNAFEDDAVGGEEEGSLCWQDVWAPQQAPSGLLPAVSIQKHPQTFRHQLLSRKQSWTQNLRLRGKHINYPSCRGAAKHTSHEDIWAYVFLSVVKIREHN